MIQFNYLFLENVFVCLKGSNMEGNADRGASDLISVDAKYSSG